MSYPCALSLLNTLTQRPQIFCEAEVTEYATEARKAQHTSHRAAARRCCELDEEDENVNKDDHTVDDIQQHESLPDGFFAVAELKKEC